MSSKEDTLNNPFKNLDKAQYRDARDPKRPAPVKIKKSDKALPGAAPEAEDDFFAGLMRESGVSPLEPGNAKYGAARRAATTPAPALEKSTPDPAPRAGLTAPEPAPRAVDVAPPAAAQGPPAYPPTPPRPGNLDPDEAALTLGDLSAFAALKAQTKTLPRRGEKPAPPLSRAAKSHAQRVPQAVPAPPDDLRAGLRAASPLEAAPAHPPAPPAPASAAQSSRQTAIPSVWQADAPDTDADLFASAMAGVQTMSGKGRDVPQAAPPRPLLRKEPASDPLQDFMDGKVEFSLEFTDEYLQGHIVGLDSQIINKMKAGEFSSEAHLDLHGLNAAGAWEALVGFFRSAYHKGLRCVLVVPGRGLNSPGGAGVLRERLQTWFTQAPFKYAVLAFCTALPKHGGAGALYVLLRKQKKSRGKIHWDIIPADADLLD